MHSEAVREIKWMIFGATLMTTGSLFAATVPIIGIFGLLVFLGGFIMLVGGFVGEIPREQLRE